MAARGRCRRAAKQPDSSSQARQAQDEVARFLAPHVPVASPLATRDGSFVCVESLPVGGSGARTMHAVRMSKFLQGRTLDKAEQVVGECCFAGFPPLYNKTAIESSSAFAAAFQRQCND